MKSIKTKIILSFCCILLIVCAGVGVSSIYLSTNALTNTSATELEGLAKQGAEVVRKSLEEQWSMLEALALNDKIRDANSTWDEKSKILQEEKERTGAINVMFADEDGNTKAPDGSDVSVKERDRKSVV